MRRLCLRRPKASHEDGRDRWFFKVTPGRDPLTGKRVQITQRGFRTAAEAGRARREVMARINSGQVRPSSTLLPVNELLDLYLDGIDADGLVRILREQRKTQAAERLAAPGSSGTPGFRSILDPAITSS